LDMLDDWHDEFVEQMKRKSKEKEETWSDEHKDKRRLQKKEWSRNHYRANKDEINKKRREKRKLVREERIRVIWASHRVGDDNDDSDFVSD
jgi:hypothetical protein